MTLQKSERMQKNPLSCHFFLNWIICISYLSKISTGKKPVRKSTNVNWKRWDLTTSDKIHKKKYNSVGFQNQLSQLDMIQ